MKKWIVAIIAIVALVLLGFFVKGVFDNTIQLHPIAFRVGPFEVHWYGIVIAAGIIFCYLIASRIGMRQGMNEEHMAEAIIVCLFFGIAGARLYYVFSQWDMYKDNPLEIFMTWRGGLAIYGGVLGALLGAVLYTRYRKNCSFTLFQGTDLAATFLPLGQAIGRWGNFFNYEAYGSPTDLPWKMFIPLSYRMQGYERYDYFHPTFLYESAWDILTFCILFYFYTKKRKHHGEVTALYFIVYSFGRIFVESLRLDSLYWGGWRAAQVTGVALLVIGLLMLFYFRKKGRPISESPVKPTEVSAGRRD
ncbi:MAG TPA: prolipoprotein diacylglyceryl transferase [Thermotogota bacterium]|jgi:phosphatidylglycerol:prolipoprotein diacylglycerol transferase|nr:prolipoprotein diacylglyceryl transferase [Thermotogota bacterium]HOD90877.1 prolipoprotein diacylglyceryl transferase [Thermotogota bacterium]HOF23528.1 prolipoprotein diacylglyceryl transferase [Thermotogota bacterium]HOM55008.1 prolipoprotein diacylglyceryl transferase [Thermotogota bacterium]HOS24824.1 prolipoprotein diacylglyceryl transferase [Thermotogota bacterium]